MGEETRIPARNKHRSTFFKHTNNPELNKTLTDVVLQDSDVLMRQFVIQNVSDDKLQSLSLQETNLTICWKLEELQ
jgi:hypothetical protein